MTTEAALLSFAAEFTVFLVALASAVVVARGVPTVIDAPRDRGVLATGLLLFAAAAFLAGADLVDDPMAAASAAPRVAGLLLVLGGLRRWDDRRSRAMLTAGSLGWAASLGSFAADADTLARWLAIAGAVTVGAGALVAARRSISARITASAAGTLLVVVVAVSLALSNVLVSNVEDEAIRRAEARALGEASIAEDAAVTALRGARNLATTFAELGPRDLDELADKGRAGAPESASRLQRLLDVLARPLVPSGPVVYVNAKGEPVALAGKLPRLQVIDLVGSRVVAAALEGTTTEGVQSVQLIGNGALAVGAAPVRIAQSQRGGPRRVGAFVATERLGESYLEARRILRSSDADAGTARGADEGLAFVGRSAVLARSGATPGKAALMGAARAALDRRGSASVRTNDYFVVAAPVEQADGSATLALVVVDPVSVIASTRDDLFQTLFVAALVAALLAVLLAAFVGGRIGSGIRRLTAAAEAMGEGDLTARADIASADEVGVLADTFNSMATSISSMTGDLRRAAEEEAELRGRLEAVVDGVGEALVAFDRVGRITDFNRAAEALTGVRAAGALDRRITEVLRVQGEGEVDIAAQLAEIGGPAWSATGTVIQPGGAEIPVLVSTGSVRGADDEVIGSVVVLRDMRREREIEQMKTDFLSNISHELRTPLTPIKGYAGLMVSRKLRPDDAHRFGVVIQDSVLRVERLVDQLVDFATIAGGRLALRPTVQPVRDVLDDAIERWADRFPASHRLTRRVGRGASTVYGDRRYIDKALDELIDNAVKFSPGGGTVSVTAGVVKEGRRTLVELAVADQGEGIDPDRLGELREAFIQGDPSATRRFGGLGVGLALVDRIASAHNGFLKVEGKPKKGSRFALVLPMTDSGANRPTRTRGRSGQTHAKGAPGRRAPRGR